MSVFCENLIRLRKEGGVSQQKLATAVQVTQQCVSEWENGNIEPIMTNLIKIADFFDVSIDYLVGRKDY